MTSKIKPMCPRCKGALTLVYDDLSYSVENKMTIGVECWDCNITGNANFKLTKLDIRRDNK